MTSTIVLFLWEYFPLPSPLPSPSPPGFIGIPKTKRNKMLFNKIPKRYEALFLRYPSSHAKIHSCRNNFVWKMLYCQNVENKE